MTPITDLDEALHAIQARRRDIDPGRSLLVGLSGIDASGKGYVANQIVCRLWQQSIHAVPINIDGWLNLPAARFSSINPGEHFYHHAIRFPELFSQLVQPLRAARSIRLEADFAEETASEYRKHNYSFTDVDVIVLEGVFLFKREFLDYYDLRVWVDCSFETALKRAINRGQEHLPAAETIKAYDNIYFPAQLFHFKRDHPRAHADLIIDNDLPAARARGLTAPLAAPRH